MKHTGKSKNMDNSKRTKRVTIDDVARYVGVSKATVSLALNRNPLVARETQERVMDAAEYLGYRANYFARRLSMGRSEIIGLFILRGEEHLCNWTLPSSWMFYNPILRGVTSYLSSQKYRFQLETITFEQCVRSSIIAGVIQEGSLDGILLLIQDEGDYGFLEIAKEMHFPLVVMNGAIREDISTVKIDNELGARNVVEYLRKLGHKRIAHISGPSRDLNALERRNGFVAAMSAAGITLDQAYIKYGDWQIASGRMLCRELLELEEPPTAIFCANDHMVIGAVQALQNLGLRVPQEVSVIGFDNTELCTVVSPQITTVEQPLEEMGIVAAQEVLRQIGEGTAEVNRRNLAPKLIVRNSCAPCE